MRKRPKGNPKNLWGGLGNSRGRRKHVTRAAKKPTGAPFVASLVASARHRGRGYQSQKKTKSSLGGGEFLLQDHARKAGPWGEERVAEKRLKGGKFPTEILGIKFVTGGEKRTRRSTKRGNERGILPGTQNKMTGGKKKPRRGSAGTRTVS